MRLHLASILFPLAAIPMLATSPVGAASTDPIKAAFGKFVAAQNAHDLKAIGDLLSDSPDFLWITQGHVIRGRAAALKRFGELFQHAWRVNPDWSTLQIMMLDVSTAEVFVRAFATTGARAQPARMNQIFVNTPRGWRVLSIVPEDAPQR